GADHGAPGRAHMLPPRPAGDIDRAVGTLGGVSRHVAPGGAWRPGANIHGGHMPCKSTIGTLAFVAAIAMAAAGAQAVDDANYPDLGGGWFGMGGGNHDSS